MTKTALAALCAAAALAFPTTAFAQSDTLSEVTVGVTAGYHDLGLGEEISDQDLTDFDIQDGGAIFGGFVALDFPVGSNLFAGIEGNASFGTEAIDAEYGASLRFGFRSDSGTKLYLRGGYQAIDVDAAGVLGFDEDLFDEDDFGLDSTVDDYLVGAGVEFPVGGLRLRGNVDTVAFDTFRATAGVGYAF